MHAPLAGMMPSSLVLKLVPSSKRQTHRKMGTQSRGPTAVGVGGIANPSYTGPPLVARLPNGWSIPSCYGPRRASSGHLGGVRHMIPSQLTRRQLDSNSPALPAKNTDADQFAHGTFLSSALTGMVALLGSWWRVRSTSAERRKRSRPPRRVYGERRRAPRHPCLLDAICRRVGAAMIDRRLAAARDLSASGINLMLVGKPYQPDALLTLELDSADRGLSRLLLVRIKHAVEHEPGQWLMGCAFEDRLCEAEVQALLADAASNSGLREDARARLHVTLV